GSLALQPSTSSRKEQPFRAVCLQTWRVTDSRDSTVRSIRSTIGSATAPFCEQATWILDDRTQAPGDTRRPRVAAGRQRARAAIFAAHLPIPGRENRGGRGVCGGGPALGRLPCVDGSWRSP